MSFAAKQFGSENAQRLAVFAKTLFEKQDDHAHSKERVVELFEQQQQRRRRRYVGQPSAASPVGRLLDSLAGAAEAAARETQVGITETTGLAG